MTSTPLAIACSANSTRTRRHFSATRDTTKPLGGIRVLVTRAPDQAAELTRLLEVRGAQVRSVPLIRIGPPPNEQALQAAINDVDRYAWVVFTSVHGVEAFARRVKRSLSETVQIAVIGPSTQAALHEHLGRNANVMPEAYSSEGLAMILRARVSAHSRMLLLTAHDARPVLENQLRAAGYDVTKVDAYTTVRQAPADLGERIAQCDVITLGSPSVVRALVGALGEREAAEKLRGKLLACIGPVTLFEARERGLHVEVAPESATFAALVDALSRYYEGIL